MKLALIPTVALSFACGGGGGDGDDVVAPPVDAPDPVPAGCITNDVRGRKTVVVSGTVVDFATGAPVAGVTVDVTTAWDVTGNLPHLDCPLLATVTTSAQGRFGPVELAAGSTQNPATVLFTVHGGDRTPTLSDNRTCAAARCDLDHTIAAPSSALAAAWRAELGQGGMTAADSRGLVAFLYKNADGSPADHVVPFRGSLVTTSFRVGPDLRFLGPDRATLAPAAQADTTAAGVALIGVDVTDNVVYVGGRRGNQAWAGAGCLVQPGAIFLEDKTVTP